MIQNIGIIGAGLMGHGIALTFARAGFQINIFDPSTESLDQLPDRIKSSMDALGCTTSDRLL